MIDERKVELAVSLLLEGIGEDGTREGLADTPRRIARMYQELFEGMELDPENFLQKTFPVEHTGMVVEQDITFYSICEHHLLPFYGKVHIGYIPDQSVVGLSKLARTVELFARRLQIQERMTAQIGEAVMNHLKPKGVIVVAEAEHLCMTMRGIKKPGSKTMTIDSRGIFRDNPDLEHTFFQLLERGRT